MKQPRQFFDTADDAAVFFARSCTALSQRSGSEYGAVIYKKLRRKSFYLGKTRIGNSRHVLKIFFESVFSFLLFRKAAGTIHTHTKAHRTPEPNNWNCGFSYWDNFLIGIRYLCAPNGVLYKSEKRRENTIVISGLPKSGADVSDKEVYPNY